MKREMDIRNIEGLPSRFVGELRLADRTVKVRGGISSPRNRGWKMLISFTILVPFH